MNRLALPCNREAMDDDELIASVAAGDDTALRELFSRHAPWLAARLRSVLSATDVEDVLQETFLAVWTGARGYRPEGSAGGWVWGIARRQAARFLRGRDPAVLSQSAAAAASGSHAGDPAEAALARAEITDAVAVLGPEGSPEREVWRLMYCEVVSATARRKEGTMSDPDAGRDHPAAATRAHPDSGPPDVDLGRVWTGIAARVWRREPGWLEWAAGRLLRSPGLARALLTTPSLLVPWLIATVVVVGAGALATLGTGQPLVWVVTPALAAAGIAYAYGPGMDPAWELSCSMAVSDRMVLLVRALAVFAVNAALGLAAAGMAAWVITVLSAWVADGQLTAAVTSSALVVPYLAAAACCVVVAVYATRIPRGMS